MSAGDRQSREAYLWDRREPKDEELAAMERVLALLRYQPCAFTIGQTNGPANSSANPLKLPLRAAAALGLLMAGVWAASILSSPRTASPSEHVTVIALAGAPRADNSQFATRASLLVGQWLETDAISQAEMAVSTYGTVTVDPESRIRLIRAQKGEQRLELARGSISAFITAPPRMFIVDTPAATAFDLGCAYRMRVDERGDGEIEVTLGWVSMEFVNNRSASIVPFGAKCITRKGIGAGTPFYGDADAAMINALRSFDFESGGNAAMRTVLANARPRDTLTLWHLLERTSGSEREQVFNRLVELSPPPVSISKDALLSGDSNAWDAWFESFIWSPVISTR